MKLRHRKRQLARSRTRQRAFTFTFTEAQDPGIMGFVRQWIDHMPKLEMELVKSHNRRHLAIVHARDSWEIELQGLGTNEVSVAPRQGSKLKFEPFTLAVTDDADQPKG